MESDAGSSSLDACGRCGCPLVGNESFCSACGRRLAPFGRRERVRLAIGIALLAAFAAAGMCELRSSREPPFRARAPAPTPTRIRNAERP
jgi:hypothetical protein